MSTITSDTSSNGGAIWEWLGEGQFQKNVPRIFCCPPDDLTYGTVIEQDCKPAEETVSFRSTGITLAEINVIKAAAAKRYAPDYTITDNFGQQWIGKVMSITYKGIAGAGNPTEINRGAGLYTATISLRLPIDNAATASATVPTTIGLSLDNSRFLSSYAEHNSVDPDDVVGAALTAYFALHPPPGS